MRSGLRSCATAGVALAGAGLVGAPTTPPPPDIQTRAVELAASPIDPYVDLVTNTLGNLGTILGHRLDDPLPILVQVSVNGAGYQQTTISSLVAAGEALGAAVGPAPALTPLLAIPQDVTHNLASAVAAWVDALGPVGLAAAGPVNATIIAAGQAAQNFVGQLDAGNLPGALAEIIEVPAQILNATLNNEGPSGIPGDEGLLAPFRSASQTGLVDALVNYLPRTVAQAIGALPAPIDADPPPLEFADWDLGALLNPVADAAATLVDVAP